MDDISTILVAVRFVEYISSIGIYGYIVLVLGNTVLFNLVHRTLDKPLPIIENLHD